MIRIFVFRSLTLIQKDRGTRPVKSSQPFEMLNEKF